MKPKRILLARHGKSAGNADKTIYTKVPDYALPLTNEGCAQAQTLGDQILKVIGDEKLFCYISPWRRTRETFMHAMKKLPRTQWHAIEDHRLREQEWGHLRTKEASDILEKERDAYGTFYYRFKDGESGADVYDRCTQLLETVYRDFQKTDYPENAIFFGHGFTNRMLLTRWLHWTTEQFEMIANPRNCELWVMELQPDGHYKLGTPLRTHKVAHQNVAIPPGYEEIMPLRPMPVQTVV